MGGPRKQSSRSKKAAPPRRAPVKTGARKRTTKKNAPLARAPAKVGTKKRTTKKDASKLAMVSGARSTKLALDISRMIEGARQHVARAANAALTALYWQIGRRIRQDVLKV